MDATTPEAKFPPQWLTGFCFKLLRPDPALPWGLIPVPAPPGFTDFCVPWTFYTVEVKPCGVSDRPLRPQALSHGHVESMQVLVQCSGRAYHELGDGTDFELVARRLLTADSDIVHATLLL